MDMMRLSEYLKEMQGVETWTVHNMSGYPKKFRKIDGFWEHPTEVKNWINSRDIPSTRAERSEKSSDEKLRAQWEREDRRAERDAARLKKLSHPSLAEIWDEVENAIGNSFPDGDPIDSLHDYMDKHDVTMDEINLAVKKNVMGRGRGKKNYGMYDYLADMWDDMARDRLHDAKMGAHGEHYEHEWFAGNNPWRSS
jgi:hypothetical protein